MAPFAKLCRPDIAFSGSEQIPANTDEPTLQLHNKKTQPSGPAAPLLAAASRGPSKPLWRRTPVLQKRSEYSELRGLAPCNNVLSFLTTRQYLAYYRNGLKSRQITCASHSE